jgi:hypothetical protein
MNLSKMDLLALEQLSNGSNYVVAYKNLKRSGYSVDSVDSFRNIVRRLKRDFRCDTLYQLGYKVGISGSSVMDVSDISNELISLRNENNKLKVDYAHSVSSLKSNYEKKLSIMDSQCIEVLESRFQSGKKLGKLEQLKLVYSYRWIIAGLMLALGVLIIRFYLS